MLSPEPVGKGSTYRGHFRGMGQVMVELTAHDRPQRFATRERSRMATGDFEFVLTPYGEQTQVELRMQLQPHGPMRLLQPLMRRKIGQFLTDLPGHIQKGLDSAGSKRGSDAVSAVRWNASVSQGFTKSRDLPSSHLGDAARYVS